VARKFIIEEEILLRRLTFKLKRRKFFSSLSRQQQSAKINNRAAGTIMTINNCYWQNVYSIFLIAMPIICVLRKTSERNTRQRQQQQRRDCGNRVIDSKEL
jgi:DNA replication protein DnaD